MINTGLIAKHSLSDEDVAQIRELEAVCNHADGIQVKFNWDLTLDRDTVNAQDFCWYEGGRIVGYAPLDGFGQEYELTGAVLPAYRRQGIFRRLFEAARNEARRRQVRQLLLVSYPRWPAGTTVARRLGTSYRFSEYHMEAEVTNIPPPPRSEIRLHRVTLDDIPDLSRTLGASFGNGRWNGLEELSQAIQKPDQHYFLAKIGAETVGQIGAIAPPEGEVYLRAIGILPRWRHQGYGRQMLAAAVRRLMVEGHTRFSLDVETKNAQALSLYESCGFRETVVYDYSDVPVA